MSYVAPEFMMQAEVGQVHERPSSWFMPRLWPSSWATMEANEGMLLLVNCRKTEACCQ